MKQKDIALILGVIFISAIFSFFISNLVFGGKKDRQQEVEKVMPISASFTDVTQPEFKKYFNDQSINPTQTIKIGDGGSIDPFTAPPSN
jgi:hypothetical protein